MQTRMSVLPQHHSVLSNTEEKQNAEERKQIREISEIYDAHKFPLWTVFENRLSGAVNKVRKIQGTTKGKFTNIILCNRGSGKTCGLIYLALRLRRRAVLTS